MDDDREHLLECAVASHERRINGEQDPRQHRVHERHGDGKWIELGGPVQRWEIRLEKRARRHRAPLHRELRHLAGGADDAARLEPFEQRPCVNHQHR